MGSKSVQVEKLGLEKVWGRSRGAGVRVAVLDTGVSMSNALPPSRVQVMKADGGPSAPTADTHGTSSCSVVGSELADAEGAAPEAEVLAIQIATSADAIRAAEVVRGFERALTEGCDVISCSFTLHSWAGKKDAIANLVRQAHLAGIPVFASAGNVPSEPSLFPEEIQHAVVVSAHTTRNSAMAVRFNAWTDIFCLGDRLTVVNGSGLKRQWVGAKTSGATALVAGVSALALAAVSRTKRPKVGAALEGLLKATASRIPLPGGETGLRVDARKLVAAAMAI